MEKRLAPTSLIDRLKLNLRRFSFSSQRLSIRSGSAVALLVDSDQHTVSVLTNGAPVPVQVQPDGRAKLMGEIGGPPLGSFQDIEICTIQYSIAGGGTIYLWTDGLGELADTFGVHPLSLAFALQEGDRNGAKLPILKRANDDILFAAVLLPANDPGVGLLQPIILEMYAGNQTQEIDEIAAGWERNFRLAMHRTFMFTRLDKQIELVKL
jgi:hypothetical protein